MLVFHRAPVDRNAAHVILSPREAHMKREEKVPTVEQPESSRERESYEAPVLVEYGRLSVQFAAMTSIK